MADQELLSFQELYDAGKTEMETRTSKITDFEEGSIADCLLGVTATMAEELQNVLVDRINRTFTDLAEGDHLETLLTDHFGDDFARPGAAYSSGVVTFSRPDATAGAVTIPAGTVVSTATDASGESKKFATEIEVDLGALDLTIDASVTAEVAGVAGNVSSDKIVIIDSSLTDPSITVNNAAQMTGGSDELTDAEYRTWARLKVETIRGGTCTAIQAAALTVPGVESAAVVEYLKTVIEWDPSGGTPIGEDFFLPVPVLYIADANGTADITLINAVKVAVDEVRACGIEVQVESGIGLTMQWDFSLVLNPGGPNFAELSSDTESVRRTGQTFINNLVVGQDFVRSEAEDYIMSVWGPLGSNDVTEVTTNVPTGDLESSATEKFLASLGDVTTS